MDGNVPQVLVVANEFTAGWLNFSLQDQFRYR